MTVKLCLSVNAPLCCAVQRFRACGYVCLPWRKNALFCVWALYTTAHIDFMPKHPVFICAGSGERRTLPSETPFAFPSVCESLTFCYLSESFLFSSSVLLLCKVWPHPRRGRKQVQVHKLLMKLLLSHSNRFYLWLKMHIKVGKWRKMQVYHNSRYKCPVWKQFCIIFWHILLLFWSLWPQ